MRDTQGDRSCTCSTQSWAGCQHLMVITEEDEEQKWQKPAGRWIQLDSENSDLSLRKAEGRRRLCLQPMPANCTSELDPSMSPALCFRTPDGLHRAQTAPVIQPALWREERSTPQLAKEVSSGHKQGEWLPDAEPGSICRKLQEQVGAGNTFALPGEFPYCCITSSNSQSQHSSSESQTRRCCAYLDEVHADKPEEVVMPGELLEILCQGDPLLLGDGMFLNVQPEGRGGKTSNCKSLAPSRGVPPALLV